MWKWLGLEMVERLFLQLFQNEITSSILNSENLSHTACVS